MSTFMGPQKDETFVAFAFDYGNRLGSISGKNIQSLQMEADTKWPSPHVSVVIRGEWTSDGTFHGKGKGRVLSSRGTGGRWHRENPESSYFGACWTCDRDLRIGDQVGYHPQTDVNAVVCSSCAARNKLPLGKLVGKHPIRVEYPRKNPDYSWASPRLSDDDMRRISSALDDAQEDAPDGVDLRLTPMEMGTSDAEYFAGVKPTLREVAGQIAHSSRLGSVAEWEAWIKSVLGRRDNPSRRNPVSDEVKVRVMSNHYEVQIPGHGTVKVYPDAGGRPTQKGALAAARWAYKQCAGRKANPACVKCGKSVKYPHEKGLCSSCFSAQTKGHECRKCISWPSGTRDGCPNNKKLNPRRRAGRSSSAPLYFLVPAEDAPSVSEIIWISDEPGDEGKIKKLWRGHSSSAMSAWSQMDPGPEYPRSLERSTWATVRGLTGVYRKFPKANPPGSKQYLKRFFDEKGIDPDDTFEVTSPSGTWNLMSYGVVIDAIKGASSAEQAKIADQLRRIDFANGDVRHYLRHLAKALVRETNPRGRRGGKSTCLKCHAPMKGSGYWCKACEGDFKRSNPRTLETGYLGAEHEYADVQSLAVGCKRCKGETLVRLGPRMVPCPSCQRKSKANPLTGRETDRLLAQGHDAVRVSRVPTMSRDGRLEAAAVAYEDAAVASQFGPRAKRGQAVQLQTSAFASRDEIKRKRNPLDSHKPGCRCIFHSGRMGRNPVRKFGRGA